MFILFKFLWTEITFSTFMAFLWGILFGVLIMVFIYVNNVLLSLRKSRYIMNKRVREIDKTEIEAIIKSAQEDYLIKRKQKDAEEKYYQMIILGLVNDIAKLYYPKSKRPVAELTIDELVLLSRYITDTIDEVLSRPAIKIFKKMKLSTVLNVADIRNAKVVKAAQKYQVSKVVKYTSMVWNCINPFYWFKKAVFDTSFALITKKISLVIISVVGEQTNKVFSREALVDEQNDMNLMLKEIDDDMANIQDNKDEKQIDVDDEDEKLVKEISSKKAKLLEQKPEVVDSRELVTPKKHWWQHNKSQEKTIKEEGIEQDTIKQ